MRIIDPSVELWQQSNPITHVARCARVCYGNAVSKGEEADKKLYDSLVRSGHISMLRHESVYAIIPATFYKIELVQKYDKNPYIEVKWGTFYGDNIYVATNGNFMYDLTLTDYVLYETIKKHQVSAEEFANTEVGRSMMRYTFHIITQISTSRELNRVSPNSIAERSTRYVDENNGVICRPHWLTDQKIIDDVNEFGFATEVTYYSDSIAYGYLNTLLNAFNGYKALALKREDARGLLPLDTATEVIYTYSIKEWKHIIALRSDKRAHPNAQIIANMVKAELERLGYSM